MDFWERLRFSQLQNEVRAAKASSASASRSSAQHAELEARTRTQLQQQVEDLRTLVALMAEQLEAAGVLDIARIGDELQKMRDEDERKRSLVTCIWCHERVLHRTTTFRAEGAVCDDCLPEVEAMGDRFEEALDRRKVLSDIVTCIRCGTQVPRDRTVIGGDGLLCNPCGAAVG